MIIHIKRLNFIFFYLLQPKLQAVYESLSSYEKFGDFAAFTADDLRPIDKKHIDLAVNSHALLDLTTRSISQSVLDHMEGHYDFLSASR